MPADITGTNILVEEGGQRIFQFQSGPIFANLVLADEINRATPKTQSSLLEAMQEHQVTVARNRYVLDPPFFVLATQNPLEMEGTYPAARGAARPVPVQGHGPLPVRGGPDRDHGPDDRRRGADGRQDRERRRDRRDAAARARRADRAARDRLRRRAPRRHAPGPAPRAGARPRLRPLRRLAARRPGARDRGQDLRAARRPVQRRRSTTSARWPCPRCGTA